jgi:two-component system, OmpR family, sensor kinase
MKRLSLRVRLTLAFATAMALVLTAMGLFVYFRVGGALGSSVDQSLNAQAAETSAHLNREQELHDSDVRLVDPDTTGGPAVAEVLDSGGAVLRSTPPGLRPLMTRSELAGVLAGTRLRKTTGIAGQKHEWRLLAERAGPATRPVVLVVGRSLESRQETLSHLFREFLIAGPIALLLASLLGYGLASGALRPVESMRRRAEAISAATPGRRLPVPEARDEIARLAETLNDMLARLEAAFEHERRFVADASHELRTPLALLRTELEVALRRRRTHGELEAALRSAAEEAERLSKLAEDLLLIARSDQGHLPIRRERVPASELLAGAAERYAGRAQEAGRSIVTEPADGLALDADPARLEQALGNLIDNALTHGAGTVELSARANNGLVELHVADSGAGFPPGFAARAFDRFSRADEARARGGTGLGLSIVQLIAAAHGGEVGAASRAGGGADVWIAVSRGS